MGIEKKTTTIGAYGYEIETFGARQGMSVLLTLIKFIGPALSDAASSEGEDNDSIARAFRTFAETAKDSDFAAVADAFAAKTVVLIPTTTVAGESHTKVSLSKIYDAHFSGDYASLLAWLVWCARENFGRFFDAPPGELKELLGRMR